MINNCIPRLIIIIHLSICMFLTACKDEDHDAVVPDLNACLLAKEVYASGGYYRNFEYNAQGFLTKAIGGSVTSNPGSYQTNYIYNTNNQLIRIDAYSNGQLDSYHTFEYTNDLVSTSGFYSGKGDLYYNTTYKYDGDKRLIEEEFVDINLKYTYDSKGNIKQEIESIQGVVLSSTTYEDYDDKNTPHAALKGIPAVTIIGVSPVLTQASRNNPRKIIRIDDNNLDGVLHPSEGVTTTYAYKYNDQNFPSEIKETFNSATETITFTYNCN